MLELSTGRGKLINLQALQPCRPQLGTLHSMSTSSCDLSCSSTSGTIAASFTGLSALQCFRVCEVSCDCNQDEEEDIGDVEQARVQALPRSASLLQPTAIVPQAPCCQRLHRCRTYKSWCWGRVTLRLSWQMRVRASMTTSVSHLTQRALCNIRAGAVGFGASMQWASVYGMLHCCTAMQQLRPCDLNGGHFSEHDICFGCLISMAASLMQLVISNCILQVSSGSSQVPRQSSPASEQTVIQSVIMKCLAHKQSSPACSTSTCTNRQDAKTAGTPPSLAPSMQGCAA